MFRKEEGYKNMYEWISLSLYVVVWCIITDEILPSLQASENKPNQYTWSHLRNLKMELFCYVAKPRFMAGRSPCWNYTKCSFHLTKFILFSDPFSIFVCELQCVSSGQRDDFIHLHIHFCFINLQNISLSSQFCLSVSLLPSPSSVCLYLLWTRHSFSLFCCNIMKS
jgi:hypothetical protein